VYILMHWLVTEKANSDPKHCAAHGSVISLFKISRRLLREHILSALIGFLYCPARKEPRRLNIAESCNT
jgi:hypothetical protein